MTTTTTRALEIAEQVIEFANENSSIADRIARSGGYVDVAANDAVVEYCLGDDDLAVEMYGDPDACAELDTAVFNIVHERFQSENAAASSGTVSEQLEARAGKIATRDRR